MAQLDEIVGKSNIQGVIEMDKALISLDETFMRVLKSSKETASVLNSSTASYTNLKKAQEDTVKQTEKLSAAEKEAEKIAKEQAATLAALDKQRTAAYKKEFDAQQKKLENEKKITAAIAMEVKSIEDAEIQNKALTTAKKQLNLATEEGRKLNEKYNQTIDKNTDFIRQNSDAATRQRMNIGNYPQVIGNVTKSVSGLATGMFPMLASFTVFQNLLTGTEAAGDKFEQISSSIGYSLKFLSDRLLELNFTGLISGFRDAWNEGKRYKEVLQEIEDLQVGLGLQEKAAQLRISQLEMIAKSERSTNEQRKEALAEILKLEEELRTKRIELSNKDTQNELENIAKLIFGNEGATEVRKTLILGLVKDQKMFNDLIQQGTDLHDYLNSLIKTEITNRGTATRDYTEYYKAVEKLTDQQRLQLDIAEINTKLSGEQRERIAKAYGNTLDALKAEQDAKNALIRLDNKLYKAELKGSEDVNEAHLTGAGIYDELTKSIQAYARAVDELPEPDVPSDYSPEADPEIQRLEGLQEELNNLLTTTQSVNQARLAELERFHELALISEEQYQAGLADIEDKARQDKLDKAQSYVNFIADFGNTLLSIQQQQLDNEVQQMENAKNYELQLAGDNAEKRTEIEEKYAEQERALKIKAAKQNKTTAIFNAIIGTANAVINGLATVPFVPLGIIMGALAGVLGAVQIGLIASQPIPQFFKGTDSAPDGLISVGEKGRELIQTRSGKVLMANEQTVLSGMKGAKIYSNEETEAILKAGRAGYDSKELKTTLERNNEKLIRTIQNKREVYLDFSTRKVSEREGGHWTHYKNRYFR